MKGHLHIDANADGGMDMDCRLVDATIAGQQGGEQSSTQFYYDWKRRGNGSWVG